MIIEAVIFDTVECWTVVGLYDFNTVIFGTVACGAVVIFGVVAFNTVLFGT